MIIKGNFWPIALWAIALASCGGGSTGDDSAGELSASEDGQPASNVDTSAAEEFFADLPKASTVAPEQMGDLYFKLLTRVKVKIDAVDEASDTDRTRGFIEYVRQEVAILDERSASLPLEQRKELFGDSVAQIGWAQQQYSRAVQSLERSVTGDVDDFIAYADQDWPQLGDER